MSEAKRSHIHMNYIKPFMILSGFWLLDLKGFKKFLYDFYFYITFLAAFLNVPTLCISTIESIKRGNFAETANNIACISFGSIILFKAWTYRSKGIKKLLEKILKIEKIIFEKYDEECREIYKRNVAASELSAFYFIYQGFFFVVCVALFPLIMTLFSKPDEDGHVKKYYIIPNWYPFDQDKYYYTVYFTQVLDAIIIGFYVVLPTVFFLFILKNIIGQLLVLQHKFTQINNKAIKHSKKEGTSFKQSCNYFVTECIQYHQGIISMVSDINELLRTYLLFEYLFTSIGLSALILQFLYEFTIFMKLYSGAMFLVFAAQPLVIYYHADEVGWESSLGLTQAIFESDWLDIELCVRKMLVLVILRAQKPLQFFIGPFKPIGVDSLISLFKATYSYLSVMWR